jgi:peptidoglycan/LPS O-acetylase OafA/YrhL
VRLDRETEAQKPQSSARQRVSRENPTLAYRPEIDGLRALAVAAVLGFHAFPNIVPGGYVGVDVFFVISGFLITSIVVDGSARGRLSLADFYIGRVRRLFPALTIVLAACLVAGWLLLLPNEFASLGKHVAAGAAFISSFVDVREAGYFDQRAELKPLLHLWSLGIEEQFYLVWPIVAFLAIRFKTGVFIAALVIVVASWAVNIGLTYSKPADAFYLPWSRAWELLLGGCLATAPAIINRGLRWLRDIAALAGTCLIGLAIMVFDQNSAFPGWRALLPAIGTGLIIWAGKEAWLNRQVLARPPLVGIGLMSYPLYLWHWPLLSFLAISNDRSVTSRLIAILLAVVLAWATYRLVELPVRRARTVWRPLVAGLAAACFIGLAVFTSILPAQLSSRPEIASIDAAETDWVRIAGQPIAFEDQVFYRDGGAVNAILFIGDSNMEQYYSRLHMMVGSTGTSAIYATSGGCAPIRDVISKFSKCPRFVEAAYDYAKSSDAKIVAIAAQWSGYFTSDIFKIDSQPLSSVVGRTLALNALRADLEAIRANGQLVYLVLNIPVGPEFAPRAWLKRTLSGVGVVPIDAVPRRTIPGIHGQIAADLRQSAEAAGAIIIDPFVTLCDSEACKTADERGAPIYMDRAHLRASFVRNRIDFLDQVFTARRDATTR